MGFNIRKDDEGFEKVKIDPGKIALFSCLMNINERNKRLIPIIEMQAHCACAINHRDAEEAIKTLRLATEYILALMKEIGEET